jgi:hypothetical protein
MASVMKYGLLGPQSLDEFIAKLRDSDQPDLMARPELVSQAEALSRWKWRVEDDHGLIFAAATIPDGDGRGWFCGYPGKRFTHGAAMRPVLRMFKMLTGGGAVDELRAWIRSDDERAIRFALWGGFRLDCGPATGISPAGHDMSLFLWRR